MAREHAPTNPFFSRLLEKHHAELYLLAREIAYKFPRITPGDLAGETVMSLLRSSTPRNDLSDPVVRTKFFKKVLRNKALGMIELLDTSGRAPLLFEEEHSSRKRAEPVAAQKMDSLEFREALERLSPQNQRILFLYFKHQTAAAVGRELFPHLSPKSQKALGFKAVKSAAGAFFGMPVDLAHINPMRAGQSRNPRNIRRRKMKRKA